MRKVEKFAQVLLQQRLSVSVAESCTGGLLAGRITDLPGSSAYFKLSVTAYSNDAKVKLLGIPEDVLTKNGAVSEDTAILMARKVRELGGTDLGIGITGIAGPTGGTKQKPVGLVFIALHRGEETLCVKCQFPGSRDRVRERAVNQTFDLVCEFLA